MLLTLGIGFIAASCGTKEKQMSSSSNADSTAIEATKAVADTMTTVPMGLCKGRLCSISCNQIKV